MSKKSTLPKRLTETMKEKTTNSGAEELSQRDVECTRDHCKPSGPDGGQSQLTRRQTLSNASGACGELSTWVFIFVFLAAPLGLPDYTRKSSLRKTERETGTERPLKEITRDNIPRTDLRTQDASRTPTYISAKRPPPKHHRHGRKVP